MIRVIKPGKRFRTFYQATCKRCGCQFEFDDEDIQREYNKQGTIDSHIRCPNDSCGYAITRWEELKEELD